MNVDPGGLILTLLLTALVFWAGRQHMRAGASILNKGILPRSSIFGQPLYDVYPPRVIGHIARILAFVLYAIGTAMIASAVIALATLL